MSFKYFRFRRVLTNLIWKYKFNIDVIKLLQNKLHFIEITLFGRNLPTKSNSENDFCSYREALTTRMVLEDRWPIILNFFCCHITGKTLKMYLGFYLVPSYNKHCERKIFVAASHFLRGHKHRSNSNGTTVYLPPPCPIHGMWAGGKTSCVTVPGRCSSLSTPWSY